MSKLRKIIKFCDSVCQEHLTPLIYDCTKIYCDSVLQDYFYRLLTKFIVVCVSLIILLVAYRYSFVSNGVVLYLFSVLYIGSVIDFLYRSFKNKRIYFDVIVFKLKYIENKLLNVKPCWLHAIHMVFVGRGSLPSDKMISDFVIHYVRKRVVLLAIFTLMYAILYKLLVSQFIPLMGENVAIYEQPVIAVRCLLFI